MSHADRSQPPPWLLPAAGETSVSASHDGESWASVVALRWAPPAAQHVDDSAAHTEQFPPLPRPLPPTDAGTSPGPDTPATYEPQPSPVPPPAIGPPAAAGLGPGTLPTPSGPYPGPTPAQPGAFRPPERQPPTRYPVVPGIPLDPGAPVPGAPYAAPGHPGQHHSMPPGLDPDRLVRQSAPAPSRGWRQALHTASGGLINLGDSKSQQQLDQMVARVRQPIRGDFRLAVLSLKGGVGKTTTTIGLGSAFASLRGDRVIAVDANPDLGTLASRVPHETNSTVRTLLGDPDIHRYTDIRRHTSQASSRLEVLASESDPAISEAFSADEYRRVLRILENYYNIIMTDCGTGLIHSAMEGVLTTADAIVLVTSPAVDGARSASATLDWLNAHGYQRLVQQAVVVISASKPGGAPIDLDLLTQHFLGRTRAVQVIPYDNHLATGSYVELEYLHRRTRTAFLELAATVADSFSQAATAPPGPAAQSWHG